MQDDDDVQGEDRERLELLARIDRWLEGPMLALAVAWLALLVVEFVRGSGPGINAATLAIWAVFVVHFAVQFTLAPRKLRYLRTQWLTALSLAVPALRIARLGPLLRAVRAARGLRLVRVVASLNRGMRALGASMGRRGFGYVLALTALVTFGGAAGIYAFERSPGGLSTYADALWWTAMIMTTMGSEHWPTTPEGRVLTLLLSIYAFAMFGYVTATLATFFIGRDAEDDAAEVAGRRELQAVREEIAALRHAIDRLGASDDGRDPPHGG